MKNRAVEHVAKLTQESEKVIERYLIARVQERGGMCIKLASPTMNGLPDRLCLLPNGVMFFAELKSKGKKPSILQEVIISRLRALGYGAYVIDSIVRVDELMKEL